MGAINEQLRSDYEVKKMSMLNVCSVVSHCDA
jgi:hypothetical protein